MADDSEKLTPLLSSADKLTVLEGPVRASGYDWYRVLPFDLLSPVGWVAAASRDGAPWVLGDDTGCDASAPSVTTLAQATPGMALGCYGDRPLTFDAQILDCMADIDGIAISPDWFSLMTLTVDGRPVCPVLVEPGGSVDTGDKVPFPNVVFLHLDPDGEAPDPLPFGVKVEVSGQFDHPAAQRCRSKWLDDPVLVCRGTFVVTRIETAA